MVMMLELGVVVVLLLLFAECLATTSHFETDQITVRVNTFRRNDMLKIFLDHYTKCPIISRIQVVWSDQVNSPPLDWLVGYPNGSVVFEIHRKDSLIARFSPLSPIKTNAVLSVDDDLVIPCEELTKAHRVWLSNSRSLVGFSPRMHSNDIGTGEFKYLRWQHTWWNGIYSIVLTKAAILHKDYLATFEEKVPTAMKDFIDAHRNCEDIAMAAVIAHESRSPPVWVQGVVYEIGQASSGISSGQSHFVDRGTCLAMLHQTTRGLWRWVTGYQKAVQIGNDLWDLFRLGSDVK